MDPEEFERFAAMPLRARFWYVIRSVASEWWRIIRGRPADD